MENNVSHNQRKRAKMTRLKKKEVVETRAEQQTSTVLQCYTFTLTLLTLKAGENPSANSGKQKMDTRPDYF